MELLVTGAGGFSGSHLVRALLARGHRVTALVGRSRARLDPALEENPSLTVMACNLATLQDFPVTADAVIHAAARSPAPGVTVADMVRDNVVATGNMIAYATRAGVNTFVYLSSLSIYGAIAGPEVDERSPIVDPDAYGMTKFLGELMLREVPSLRSLSIRLPGVLGPNSVRNWLTGVVERGRAGQEVSIYNAEAPFNNGIHVEDLCGFVGDVIERQEWGGHGAVTVGMAGHTTVREAVDIVLRSLDSSSRVTTGGNKRKSFTISNALAQARYGYNPAPVELTLRRFGLENRRPAPVLDGMK